ncbi:hypothetical protein [Stetteria hydrogenophila]
MRRGGFPSSLAAALARAAARGLKPSTLGVHGYKAVVRARLIAALAAPVAGALLYAHAGPLGLLAVAPIVALAAAAPGVYRRLLAGGLEREAPALLAYMLPFSLTSKGLVDVVASLQAWRGPPFSWVRREAERLAFRLRLGADPLSALEWLAETTPSKTLSAALRDYTHALRLGVPRSSVAQRLLDRAMEAMRAAWRGYVSTAKATAEAAASLAVLVAALAPAAALARVDPSLLSFILAAPPALALVLAAAQPTLGLPQTSLALRVAPLAAAWLAGLLVAEGAGYAALAFLAVAAVAVEAYARAQSARQSRAWQSLARAMEKARLGLNVEEELADAEPVAPGVLSALLEASKTAGGKGLTRAIQGVYRVIAEARSLAKSYSTQFGVLALVSVASVAIAVYSIEAIAQLAGEGYELVNPSVMAAVERILLATAPLVPLPAAAAARPWAPTLAPSLASLALALYTSGALRIPLG